MGDERRTGRGRWRREAEVRDGVERSERERGGREDMGKRKETEIIKGRLI